MSVMGCWQICPEISRFPRLLYSSRFAGKYSPLHAQSLGSGYLSSIIRLYSTCFFFDWLKRYCFSQVMYRRKFNSRSARRMIRPETSMLRLVCHGNGRVQTTRRGTLAVP